MKLGISELAWPGIDHFDTTLNALNATGISCIEMVIPKHSPWNPIDVDKLTILRDMINSSHIEVKSTQSVLFNSDVTEIGDASFLRHMDQLIDACIAMGIEKIVLGSPKQRINFNLNQLGNAFGKLDKKISNHNVTILIEPNSQKYGGEYFFTLDEIVKFLDHHNFKNIKTMIDTHNIILENQNPTYEFIKYQKYIDHIHVSEIGLKSFKESDTHYQLTEILHTHQYGGLVVYECNQSATLFNDIKLFTNIYNKVI
jgi:D-psicose/D-tagatose/L-ribulose 3-epimerase